jgi:23S rRNA (guanosine2251-2'-O)-methyltransferase
MTETTNLIYGTRAVMEAIKAGKEIERLFLQQGLSNALISELKKILHENNITYQQVPLQKLQRITRGNHQGVVGFLSFVAYQKTEDLIPFLFEQGKVPFFILLDRVTDVRNFGAIARTAVCAGVHAIIIPAQGSAQINAEAVKASAGALFNIAVCREKNIKLTLEYLKASGIRIISVTEKASTPFFKCDLTVPCCIIMGSEDDGISPEYLKRSDERITIPMVNSIASLNVSVATAIVAFEAVRQKVSYLKDS